MAEITIELLKDNDRHLWKEFLGSSINYTFYQDLDFLDYYSYKVKDVKKLVFRKKGRIIALFPAAVLDGETGLQMHAPFSASFGGFCYTNELKLAESLEIVKLLLDYSSAEGIESLSIQQPPIIYSATADEYIDFALNYSGFKIEKADLTLFVKCRDHFLDNVSSTAGNIIRRSIREKLKFEITNELSDVYPLIKKNKQNKNLSLTISANELSELKKRFPDEIKYFVVKSENEIICSSVIYLLNPRVMLVMFWAPEQGWEKVSPTYYLIYELVRYGAAQGFHYLDFGTTTVNGEPVPGVTDFKEKFRPCGALKRKYVRYLR